MTHTTEQLEAMLAAATPGPWRKSPQDGACVTSARGYIGHFSVNRNIKADTRLIAAAPTITAELIAARKRIAELEALRKPAIYSAAVIGSFYEWVERVEKAGGPTCISGIAECNAMIKSLRKNAKRADELVMKPLREAIAALEAKP